MSTTSKRPSSNVVGDIVPPPVATTLTDSEQKALAARPDYQAAQAEVRIADANVKLADAADTAGRYATILCKTSG
jgi:outer membrane protein, heavy metal efflux system